MPEPTTILNAPAPAPAPTPAPAPAPAPAAPTPGDTPPVHKDWATRRAEYAASDEKLLKRLERYSSEKDVIDALVAAQNKISSGGLKSVLPKDATSEQVAAWREENGIPAKPEDYDLTLPSGFVVGEADKPFVGDFLKEAHAKNMNPEQVQTSLDWYFAKRQEQIETQQQKDSEKHNESVEVLREDWGSEYKVNVNLIKNLFESAPAEARDNLLGARLADGTLLGDHPATLRWFASLSREVNPTATVVPGSGANALQAIESELATLKGKMADRTSDYWKGPLAAKNQARYRELVSVQEKVADRK